MKLINRTIGLSAMLACLCACERAYALLQIVHEYDIEQIGGVTEPGWTHMDSSITSTPTSPGFNAGDTHVSFLLDRSPSTQSPTNVTRDVLIGAGQGTNTPAPFGEPTVSFRDIVPADATNVDLTVYHSDPGDNFNSRFQAYYSFNGGPTNLFYDGSANGNAFYFPPIITNLALHASSASAPLDLLFFDVGFGGLGSQVRLNGFQAVFDVIPEPSTLGLLLLSGFGFVMRRRSSRNQPG